VFKAKEQRRLYFNFILLQSHKTRNKHFFYFLKKNQNNLKKQVATMQPLSTLASKGSKSNFNLKKV
jgi:hypothetical protein